MKKELNEKHFIHKPQYPGGPKAMHAFLKTIQQYPKAALQHKIEGVVRVRCTIDYKGFVTDTKVMTHLGHGCDEEAQRMVRQLKFEVPKNRGVKVLFHKNLNISFKLPKPTTTKVVYNHIHSEKSQVVNPQTSTTYSYTITLS